MPTLNIDVNARTERAKRDLRALDREILKVSKSEAILEKAIKKTGDVGPAAFRKIQSAAVKQARAVNSAALQFKQLRAQMIRLGSSPETIGKLTSEFIRFRKEMEKGVVGTTRFQKAQDRLKTAMGTTKRQVTAATAAVNKSGKAAVKGGKSFTGLGRTLENLGSTAVLVLGPLSGVGSRLIAFGAIAKRGSIAAAGFFGGIAVGGVFVSKAVSAFDKLNLSLSKTEAILKATGKEAQITAKFVEEVAASVARKTLANLEDTRPGATALLSFKGINEGNLERVLTLSQDTAALGLTDFTNALKLLGRASEDPIKNLDSLRRVGIQLTLTEKAQITTLQNMGKGIEAFNVILDIFEKKVGGLGEAENKGLEGAFDRLGQSWTHLLEDMGEGTAHELAVGAINKLADALDRFRVLKTAFKDLASSLVGSIKTISSNFKTNVESMASSLKTNVGNLADKMGESINEMGTGKGAGLGSMMAGKTLRGIGSAASSVVSGAADIKRPDSDTEKIEFPSRFKALSEPESSTDSPISKPPRPTSKSSSSTFNPPSHFSKALVDVNTSLRRSTMDLDAEREKLQTGFILMSPSILKLAERHGMLGETVKALKGDFKGLSDAELIVAYETRAANDAFLDLGRRKEAKAIFEQTLPPLVKYNNELRRITFLHKNFYINTDQLIIRQKELRATLEASLEKLKSTTPELKIITSASEKFGDSLADLMIKGEDFAEGFKGIFKSLVDDIVKEFFKLSVINPILNGIFGASADRPELGNQGGGKFGLGGAGGLLGKVMGNDAKDNASQKAPEDAVSNIEKAGSEGAIGYSKALEKTNSKMEVVGTEASFNFGSALSSLMSGLAGTAEGLLGKAVSGLGGLFGKITGGLFDKDKDTSANLPTQLLGKAMGGTANHNVPERTLGGSARGFQDMGDEAAKDYGDVLNKTNAKMGKAGDKGVGGFGDMFSSITSGLASAAGGMIGSFLGNKFADLLGFQHGGSFKVGGSGGRDSQLVAFKASPREKVTVETPNQQNKGGSGNVTYIDARGVDPGQINRLIQIVKDLDESVEIRAVNATADARDRNPSLFGRTL